MSSDYTPFSELSVHKRSAHMLSHEYTERVHLNKLTTLTRNRVLRTLDTYICHHWSGQQKRILEFFGTSYGVRFMTRTTDGRLQVWMPRVPGDDATGFLEAVNVRLKLVSPELYLKDWSTINHIHFSMWFWQVQAASIVPESEIVALFKEHFVINKDAQDKARIAVEQGKVIVTKREFPLGHFA